MKVLLTNVGFMPSEKGLRPCPPFGIMYVGCLSQIDGLQC